MPPHIQSLLRVALATLGLLAEKSRPAQAYRIRPVSLGGVTAGIGLDRSLRLSDALEGEDQVRKLERRIPGLRHVNPLTPSTRVRTTRPR